MITTKLDRSIDWFVDSRQTCHNTELDATVTRISDGAARDVRIYTRRNPRSSTLERGETRAIHFGWDFADRQVVDLRYPRIDSFDLFVRNELIARNFRYKFYTIRYSYSVCACVREKISQNKKKILFPLTSTFIYFCIIPFLKLKCNVKVLNAFKSFKCVYFDGNVHWSNNEIERLETRLRCFIKQLGELQVCDVMPSVEERRSLTTASAARWTIVRRLIEERRRSSVLMQGGQVFRPLHAEPSREGKTPRISQSPSFSFLSPICIPRVYIQHLPTYLPTNLPTYLSCNPDL